MKYAEFNSGSHKVVFSCSNFTEEIVAIDGITQSKSYIIQNKSHIFMLNDELFSLSTSYNILSKGTITITLAKNNEIIDIKTVSIDKNQRYLWIGVAAILLLSIFRIFF